LHKREGREVSNSLDILEFHIATLFSHPRKKRGRFRPRLRFLQMEFDYFISLDLLLIIPLIASSTGS
jgi:hypothetical protein